MRRTPYFLPLALCITLASNTLRAQDPAKIADQYVKAAGGSKALSKIQTMTLEGIVHEHRRRKVGQLHL